MFLLLMIGAFLTACNEKSNQDNNEDLDDIDVYDFYFINKAPESDEKHPLDELIKIYFSAKGVAIDVGEKEIYIDPIYASNGIDTFEGTVDFDDKEGLIDIIEKYNVQKWKSDYSFEAPDDYQDGYGWLLLMQFEDGTVEKYRGAGSLKEDITPRHFDAFGETLKDFVKGQIERNEDND